MADWDWKLSDMGSTQSWIATNQGHRIEAILWNPNIYEGDDNDFTYTAMEDDVAIIDHTNGRDMRFKTLAEIRRFFNVQRDVQEELKAMHEEREHKMIFDEKVAANLEELKKYTDEGRKMYDILTAPGNPVYGLSHASRDGWRHSENQSSEGHQHG